jgi:hypothetical protein
LASIWATGVRDGYLEQAADEEDTTVVIGR